ncbi:MAG: DUF4293 family protein [Bacteroidaceae bacterium]|jgi:hypothetical protein|nr:DUF4293 family protein [Bacteroidaceae bacterium]
MKIEFYLHQVWLALICILMFAGLLLPIGLLVDAEGASAELTNFRLNFIEGDSSGALWALGAILIVTLAVGVFELLLSGFRNFVLQKRLLVFMMLLTVGYYIIFVIYVLLLKGDASFGPRPAAAFPLICLVLEYMSIHGVSKAEAAIIARASGFRLRD